MGTANPVAGAVIIVALVVVGLSGDMGADVKVSKDVDVDADNVQSEDDGADEDAVGEKGCGGGGGVRGGQKGSWTT